MNPILTMTYCHLDLPQAARQLRWIGYLSSIIGNPMLEEKILLIPSVPASKHSTHREMVWLAERVFGDVMCHIPDGQMEKGWPASANWMFSQALNFCEDLKMDMFFLEPDCTPLCPDWWERIMLEWDVAQVQEKSFMGALVTHSVDHMTGNGMYSKDWRRVAPSLVTCPDNNAWDVYCAPEVLPNAHFTPLIQHMFKRHHQGWQVPSISVIDKRAVLFHQDKTGALIRMLDALHYGLGCANHPLFGYNSLSKPDHVMTKFYYTVNATKAVKIHGRTFAFEPLPVFGGSVPGVLALSLESEQIAMAEVASNPATGVKEIDQTEYEDLAKKKWVSPPTSTLEAPNNSLPQIAISPTPSGRTAEVVENPTPHSSEPDPLPATEIKDIADVLKTGSVLPSQPNT